MADVPAAVAAGDLSFLDGAALHAWVVGQRWFASKARAVAKIAVVAAAPLRTEAPLLVLCLVEARFPTGSPETYQVPLGLRPATEGWSERVVAEADGWTVYDALADAAHGRELLQRMHGGGEVALAEATVRFDWAQPADAAPDGAVDVRPVGVEQSNSSIVFGDELILKAFRRVEPGVNPELELLRYLSGQGFEHIATLAGWYDVEGRRLDATLGILQRFLAGAQDGWAFALDGLASHPAGVLDELEALGAVTGRLHSALGAADPSDEAFAADEPTAEALATLTADIDEQIERVFGELPETDATAPLRGRGQDVRELLRRLSLGAGGRVIRTHGDYHLGQTMLTDRGWVILDFEGEPARPLPERRLKRSPLRDVAGMLRSFSYASAASSLLRDAPAPDGWEEDARERFLTGYGSTVDATLLPSGPDATRRLLSVFELEKAVYELRYELNNRPDWVPIPVAGIVRLLDSA